MTQSFWIYLIAWSTFSSVVFFGLMLFPKSYSITSASYLRFLCVPWKLVTFVIASGGLTFISPYTGDPTWDYINAIFMSALTFITAPWSIGVLYLSIRYSKVTKETTLALCLWMFSVSWSYDLYLLLRDGYYPHTWLPNIFASSVLYCCAGLLWNLDWRENRGVTFSFLEKDWFMVGSGSNFRKVVWFALPFMLIVTVAIFSFLA